MSYQVLNRYRLDNRVEKKRAERSTLGPTSALRNAPRTPILNHAFIV